MGSHSKPDGSGWEEFRRMISEASDEAGLPVFVAYAFYPLWWLWEHKAKAGGALLALVGLTLTLWLAVDVVRYEKAERKVRVDATLSNSVEHERYDRTEKTHETYYVNTYRFYVDDEPQEWSETSNSPGDEVRHLRLYWDESGKWHRFDLGRGALAGVGALVLGVLLVVFG